VGLGILRLGLSARKMLIMRTANLLPPDSEDAKKVLEQLGSEPEYIEGDRFKAKPRSNVPESEKPTYAQRKARLENPKKRLKQPEENKRFL
jgi:hypothetical protein